MSVSGFTVGQDVKMSIILPVQGIITFSKVTSLESAPVITEETIQPMNGAPITLTFFKGWTGTIEGDRDDDSVDSFWAAREAAYYKGQNLFGGTLSQTITEATGVISKYLYTDVQFKLAAAGSFKGDAPVMWSMGFTAGRKLKVL